MIAEEKEIKLEALNCLSQSFPLPLINTAQTEERHCDAPIKPNSMLHPQGTCPRSQSKFSIRIKTQHLLITQE